MFSVTFSIILAYVADVTEKTDRSAAYGLVSATFAASLVTSPALGAWISEVWSDEAVVMLVNVFFLFQVFVKKEFLIQKKKFLIWSFFFF